MKTQKSINAYQSEIACATNIFPKTEIEKHYDKTNLSNLNFHTPFLGSGSSIESNFNN